MFSLDTKISEMTLGELLSAIKQELGETDSPRKIYGIINLAKYLGCSVRTAQRLKSSGRIDKAMIQSGRIIVIDADKLSRILKV